MSRCWGPYLTISHFHCSPSGQKLLTPSRYRRALCSVSAHTTLFRAVIWDSGYGQSTFMARAQGRSTLRPAVRGEESRRLSRGMSHSILIYGFLLWYFCYLWSFIIDTFSGTTTQVKPQTYHTARPVQSRTSRKVPSPLCGLSVMCVTDLNDIKGNF